MCLAIPGKILSIDSDGSCVVDYGAEVRDAKILSEGFNVGDYVIVSAKVVVMKVPKDQALDYLNAVKNY